MQTTTLLEKRAVAEGTMEFVLEKPQGFVHKAGQTIDLTLIEPAQTDAEGNMRTFSIVAAPHEGYLAVATRMRDTAFKRVLRDMPIGSQLQFDGPFGDFTLHERANRPAVILAGGIGITPFRSIVADAAHRSLPHRIILIFSNRRPEDAPFLAELTELASVNPNFTFVPTMTDIEKSSQPWQGERGQIDAALLNRHLPKAEQGAPIFYLAGPPGMVKAMRELLNSTGVSNDDIRTEEFAGY